MITGTISARNGSRRPEGHEDRIAGLPRSATGAGTGRLDMLRHSISGGAYEVDSRLVADSILRIVGRIA